jgi:hypothetical protein
MPAVPDPAWLPCDGLALLARACAGRSFAQRRDAAIIAVLKGRHPLTTRSADYRRRAPEHRTHPALGHRKTTNQQRPDNTPADIHDDGHRR